MQNPSLHPQKKKKHVNPQHKVKEFSVIKITSVRDMEISHVPVSKSLGNCEHLYNQMSSESLRESEKVRTGRGIRHTLYTGITLCTERAIFTLTAAPCFISAEGVMEPRGGHVPVRLTDRNVLPLVLHQLLFSLEFISSRFQSPTFFKS